jgi:hypothetical protein
LKKLRVTARDLGESREKKLGNPPAIVAVDMLNTWSFGDRPLSRRVGLGQGKYRYDLTSHTTHWGPSYATKKLKYMYIHIFELRARRESAAENIEQTVWAKFTALKKYV